MSASVKNVLLILFVLYYSHNTGHAQNNDEGAIMISLSNFKPLNQSTQVFDTTHGIYQGEQYIISVNHVPDKYIEFFVIQVHSFSRGVSLSYDKNYVLGSCVNGTNIGLVQVVNGASSYKFYLKNDENAANNTVYIAVLPYTEVPIPGGCNMEFTTEIAPYQILKYTDAVLTVDAEPASFKNYRCESQVVRHELYQMYLPYRISQEDYFVGVRQMLTVENITNYGTKVSKPLIGFLRQLYNVYRGTGSVYAIVATVNDSKSAYIPTVSYGCDINSPESCLNSSLGEKFLYFVISMIGIFICFTGHYFFKAEIFIFASIIGGFATFVLFSSFSDIHETYIFWTSALIGLAVGVLWLRLWLFYDITVLLTTVPIFLLGYVVACISFYAGLSDLTIINNDFTYWGFFWSIISLCWLIFMGIVETANILACTIIGSFMFTMLLECFDYMNNVKYLFVITYRHLTVENYGLAVINAPFLSPDLVVTMIWILATIHGLYIQFKMRRARSPFVSSTQPLDERTPLLSPSDRMNLIHSANA